MEFKKIEFEVAGKTYTIASVEDFIDIELALMDEEKENFYKTPCAIYFNDMVKKLKNILRECIIKLDCNFALELINDIKGLIDIAQSLVKYVIDEEEGKNELQSKIDEISLGITQMESELSDLFIQISRLDEKLKISWTELNDLINSREEIDCKALNILSNEFAKNLDNINDEKFGNLLLLVQSICKNDISFTTDIIKTYKKIRDLLSKKKELEEQTETLKVDINKEDAKRRSIKEKKDKYNDFCSNRPKQFEKNSYITYRSLYLYSFNITVNFFGYEIPAIIGRNFYNLMENEELFKLLSEICFSFKNSAVFYAYFTGREEYCDYIYD